MGPGQENRKRKARRKKQKRGGRSSGKNKLTVDRPQNNHIMNDFIE